MRLSLMRYPKHTRNKTLLFQESATLFEVQVPEFKLLQQCRKEIKMLKQLWDYIYLVRTSIDEWKTTPWKDIDVENMDMECKKFSKVGNNTILDQNAMNGI